MATKEEAIDLVSSSSSDELFDAEVAAVADKAPAAEDPPAAEQQPNYNDEEFIDLTFSSDDEGNSVAQEPGTRRGEKRSNMEIYAAAENETPDCKGRTANENLVKKPKNNLLPPEPVRGCKTMKPISMQEFLALPGVREALRARREKESKSAADIGR